jgi:hypothetical protein
MLTDSVEALEQVSLTLGTDPLKARALQTLSLFCLEYNTLRMAACLAMNTSKFKVCSLD